MDAPKIQKLYLELVGDPNIHVEENAVASLEKNNDNFLLVAEVDSNFVGTAFMTICRDVMYGTQPFAVLENVVVATETQGLGVGKALLAEVKSICKARRCTKIMLLSSAKRTQAHKFFEKNGYLGDTKRGFVNYINR